MKPWFYRRWGILRRGHGVRFVPANAMGVVWLGVMIVSVFGAFWIPTDNPIAVNDGELEGNVWASVLALILGFAIAYINSEPAPAGHDEKNDAENQ